MSYCEDCGSPLSLNAKFCGNCGSATKKPSAQGATPKLLFATHRQTNTISTPPNNLITIPNRPTQSHTSSCDTYLSTYNPATTATTDAPILHGAVSK